jgi:lambda repressor-like predicted transcriptional regulator
MDNAMAGTVGRPSEYDPAHCEKVVELGKQGMSVIEMACEIGVSRNTLETNWPAAHPEFLEAFARARDESQAWWEKTGRSGMQAKNIDAQIWSRSMAARFPNDWRETKRNEHSGPDGAPINTVSRVERHVIDPKDPNR